VNKHSAPEFQNVSTTRRRHHPIAVTRRQYPSYRVTLTDKGEWWHPNGSDFVFAYVDNNWSADLKQKVGKAYTAALAMSSSIKEAVKNTSGQTVEDGVYLLDQAAMIEAMNSIKGMGQTGVSQHSESGSGTALTITGDFFAAVLGALGGDVAPMLTYLTTQMGDMQAQVGKSTVTDNFGTVIGFISVEPGLDIIVTTFQYLYSTQETSQWFVKVPCGSVENQNYDYSYTVLEYNYDVSK